MEETNEKRQPVTEEVVAESIEKLKKVFYETPDCLFEALAKIMLSIEPTRYQFMVMVNEAIFTLKKTKITVADIVNGREELWREKFG